MRSEVVVMLAGGREVRVDLAQMQPMLHDQARAWLDVQFTQLECEPLRATGKVLLADKLIAIAQAAGSLLDDMSWRTDFARAASGALARPVVRLDLNAMTVSY